VPATTTDPITAGGPGSARHVGVTGLATMGANLARNIARRGFPIAVHNRTTAKTDAFLEAYRHEGDIVGHAELADLVAALARPRVVLVMVQAGAPVDAVIEGLVPHLEAGDVVIDGGNSDWSDTARRGEALATEGVGYVGCGVSGGEEGALNGPSLMPGGPRDAYEVVAPLLDAIAAVVDGIPCCAYVGLGGAGHYVKMVHNGIEYADMQLIAEAYDLLGTGLSMDNVELQATFAAWDEGDLDSFLIEITALVLGRLDDGGGPGYLIDQVLDAAGQKGTGRLTARAALDLGATATTITEAVFARALSARKDERVAAAEVLPGPDGAGLTATPDDIRDALYASKIVAYAQGFALLRAASDHHGFDLRPGELATIWRGGCIIRARFLDRIRDAFAEHPDVADLVLVPAFTQALAAALPGWRRVVGEAVRVGIPTPAFASALAWYDGYRRARLPANLIQAQRDHFGAHAYQRMDRPGTFHSDWAAR
jgi:6-phosphogluconate dehydrogenase